jgi:hypothetical protein
MIYFRYLLIALVAALSFTSCSNEPAETKVDPTEAPRQLINQHFQLLNAHDLKSITAQYEPKAKIITTDGDGETFGPAGADQVFHQVFYVSPDAKYLVDNMIVNDSTVVVEYDIVGLREKYNSPIRYDKRNCSVFKIKDDHITSEATYSNSRLYHNQ